MEEYKTAFVCFKNFLPSYDSETSFRFELFGYDIILIFDNNTTVLRLMTDINCHTEMQKVSINNQSE